MSESAHIYNPSSESLSDRVQAYEKIHQQWLNIESSLKFVDDPEWKNTLGTHKELESAHKIIVNGLNKATQDISIDEIDCRLSV